MRKLIKVKVLIVREDGELIDQFAVGKYATDDIIEEYAEEILAERIQDELSFKFETALTFEDLEKNSEQLGKWLSEKLGKE